MKTFQSTDGLTLAYRDEGEGLPVIALAGLTRNGDDFNFVAPHLEGVRLIRPDYRGRGQSDWAPYQSYTIQVEAMDALHLMDHLGLEQAAILGTSRGGLIAMGMAATVHERLLGVCLNDIGPVIDPDGLEVIMGYLGVPPSAKSFEAAAETRARVMDGFDNVPMSRWLEEVHNILEEDGKGGLKNRYDPALRDAVIEAGAQPIPDLWPLFDALNGLPAALIHGANSNLLSDATVAEMRRRHPGMEYAKVPDRGHVPFLDEPEALAVLKAWIEDMR
ncbi:alpha/beta hydrolase [Aliiroseovarius subalbicans]|uniref:alpha/beta fold hydrolase n=1 Tax=Aliiroseovarius subalbicans TaxID=2925840 RepID=UPI001F5A6743|nr:alpha/beta hydrolase [Aliiroseovarius subalbicans]MCI2400264.1 alpha/beta hydrolase [Aliiroseovarius subalbicans]